MEEPEHLKKGITAYRYPAVSQIVLLGAALVFFGVLIELLHAARKIDPAIKTAGTVILSVCYIVILVWVFVKPKGSQKNFITSVDALKGNFYARKVWPLIAGLYIGASALGAAVNGFLFLAIIFGVMLLIVIAASRFIKNGIRIDEGGSVYVTGLNKETIIRFEYASEVCCRYYSRLRKNFLYIIFGNNTVTGFPARLYINISKLYSEEYGTYLDPAVLSEFLKQKLTSLGFKIESTGDKVIYEEWTAKK